MVTLEVLLLAGQNEHHPKEGWYKIGTFETVKEAAECYNRAETINARAGIETATPYRVVISEEDIKRQLDAPVKPANGGVMAIIDLMIDEKKEEGLKLSYKRQFNLLADKNAEIIALIQLKSRLSV